MASRAARALQDEIRGDQVTLAVCPPHLVEKWQRELLSIQPDLLVARLDRHEDVKAFMQKASQISADVPKIGLIKRERKGIGFEGTAILAAYAGTIALQFVVA